MKNMKKLSVASLPEWSKGSDSRSFVLSTRGFKSHTLQIFFSSRKIIDVKTHIAFYFIVALGACKISPHLSFNLLLNKLSNDGLND